MNIFEKRKQRQIEKMHERDGLVKVERSDGITEYRNPKYFDKDGNYNGRSYVTPSFQASQLINLDSVTVPNYSITGSFANYEEWVQPSGTAIVYNELLDPNFNVSFRKQWIDFSLDKVVCKYCGQSYLINKSIVKELFISLNCPSCGAGI